VYRSCGEQSIVVPRHYHGALVRESYMDKKYINEVKMARLEPCDTEFVFARVVDGTRSQKTRYVMSWFEAWIRFRANIRQHGIVVFDIDDTLIDGQDRKIAAVVHAYHLCQTLGFTCAIVTARPEGPVNREETIKSLRAAGISGWEYLYMMPSHLRNKLVTDDDVRHYVSAYKRSARDDIAKDWRIVANVGDMWHDIVRFPLTGMFKCLKTSEPGDCGILFPKHAHDEVAIKLVGTSL